MLYSEFILFIIYQYSNPSKRELLACVVQNNANKQHKKTATKITQNKNNQ